MQSQMASPDLIRCKLDNTQDAQIIYAQVPIRRTIEEARNAVLCCDRRDGTTVCERGSGRRVAMRLHGARAFR